MLTAEQRAAVESTAAKRGWSTYQTQKIIEMMEEASRPADERRERIRAGLPVDGERGVRVYVMHDAGGHVKVGVSDNPWWRRCAIEACNPRDVTLVYWSMEFARWRALEVERTAHQCLSEWRHRNEWFTCNAETAIEAVKGAGGIPE